MELIAVLLMIAAGIGLALLVIVARAIGGGKPQGPARVRAAPDRDGIAASLLFHVATAGGVSADEALRDIRRVAGLAGGITRRIDVPSWAARFSETASPSQRRDLLETAVRLAIAHGRIVPLLQYVALLDLSFSLGFQTSALANLRDQYGFDYVDHAKDSRPPEADRSGGRTTFFARSDANPEPLLRMLGVEGAPTRQSIITAYRRMATQNHPDRFHEASVEMRDAAAARFIEITRAYEILMARYGD